MVINLKSEERYQFLLDLFDRKDSVIKVSDSFEIVKAIEQNVNAMIEDIFYPYEVIRTPSKAVTPDGVIKMGQRLIFYELLTGALDQFSISRIKELIEHAQKEILSLTFPNQAYSILIICREYAKSSEALLEHFFTDYRKPPSGLVILTPKLLVKLHELSRLHVKNKDQALLRILDTVGPLKENSVTEAFEASEEKAGFLETPTGPLRVTMEYGDSKVHFEGSFEEVWRSMNRFLAEMRPSHVVKAIANLTYKVEIEQLVDDLQDIVKISPDGPFVVVSTKDLNAEERILLILVGAYLGFRMGIFTEESLTTKQIASWTGLTLQTVQVKTSEMGKNRLVEIADTSKRKITTIGIQYTQTKVIPKIRGIIV